MMHPPLIQAPPHLSAGVLRPRPGKFFDARDHIRKEPSNNTISNMCNIKPDLHPIVFNLFHYLAHRPDYDFFFIAISIHSPQTELLVDVSDPSDDTASNTKMSRPYLGHYFLVARASHGVL